MQKRTLGGVFPRFLFSLALFGFFALLFRLRVPCLFRHFFGISCPGCGMTRAVWAICKLDFAEAFRLHPLVYSLPFLYAFYLADGKLFPREWENLLFAAAVLIAFLAVWIWRLTAGGI